jgi:hypothetical protein
MKASDLHAVWSAPDNTRLTAKQSSFRLPIHVAAKLAALSELYPNKTRTQIVGDLLATALETCVEGLESIRGRQIGRYTAEDTGSVAMDVFEDVGPLARFKASANKHHAELELELGNESPKELYPREWGDDAQFVVEQERGE